MIRARLYLDKAQWTINAYIAVDAYYTEEIVSHMDRLGASGRQMDSARKHLMSGNLNGGLTYTNLNGRETIWVVEITSSARELFNTVVHEIRHLQQHIGNALHLNENSEDVCYLSGDIAYALYPYIKDLLCEHCRNHK